MCVHHIFKSFDMTWICIDFMYTTSIAIDKIIRIVEYATEEYYKCYCLPNHENYSKLYYLWIILCWAVLYRKTEEHIILIHDILCTIDTNNIFKHSTHIFSNINWKHIIIL